MAEYSQKIKGQCSGPATKPTATSLGNVIGFQGKLNIGTMHMSVIRPPPTVSSVNTLAVRIWLGTKS